MKNKYDEFMGEEKLFFVYVKALLLSVTFFMPLPIMAVSLCVSKDTVAEMNKKQPVYFVNDTYVDSEDFEDMQILEDIVSIDVIKDADKNPQLKKLFDKYGKNAGLIFVRLRPGIDIKGVIGPDGKRLESERLPEFPGGKMAMFNFIEKNKKFPFALLDKGIENGSAQVTFVVKSDGTLSDIKVTKSTAPELAKEAIRVISNMPKWIPGKKRGIPSDYTRTVNIDFRGIIIR